MKIIKKWKRKLQERKFERNKLFDVYCTFAWRGTYYHPTALSFDKETNEILVDEDRLMRVIMIVNAGQKPRKIRLIKKEK